MAYLLSDFGYGRCLLVVRLGLDAALRLQRLHDVLVLPSDFVRQTSQRAVLRIFVEKRTLFSMTRFISRIGLVKVDVSGNINFQGV